MKGPKSLAVLALVGAALTACSNEPVSSNAGDSGPIAAEDGGAGDAGPADAGPVDGGPTDAGPTDGGCVPPAFARPDAGAPAPAVIITGAALRPSFLRYAALHSVTGIATDVVTVEEICAAGTCLPADPRNDSIHAIKEYLRNRPGLRYVVLGGGADIVPARSVHDSYANPLMPSYTFVADFITDYYYSDFSEWDTNADGIYAQDGVDTPGYLPTVSVSRVPVHNAAEADAYLAKVIHHLTAYDASKATKALFMSNVATKYSGMTVDSANYLEAAGRTLSLLPAGFSVSKLYATPLVDPSAGSYSAANEESALLAGQNLVVHSGHAGPGELTIEYDGSEAFTASRAFALTNSHLPIFLSCGCQAGDYSVAYNAGEKLLQAPAGGAIAYLGNAPVGLGIAGGMQMIDELLRYVKTNGDSLLGDAYLAAHQHLPTHDSFAVPLVPFPVPVVDESSYQWTQKGVVLFGDLLIPVWKQGRPAAPAMTVAKAPVCRGSALTFTFSSPATGTLRFLADGARYEIELSGQSTVSISIPQDPAKVTVGFVSPTTQYGFGELSL